MTKSRRPKYRQLTLDGIPIVLERPKQPRSGKIAPFLFKDQPLHAQIRKGEPWFVAQDACRVLKIVNTSDAVRGRQRIHKKTGKPYWSGGLDADEWGIGTADTPSGTQEVLLVNEFGLYALINKSRTKDAKEFQRWVRREVLPSIARTGSYSIKPTDRVAATQKRLGCDRKTAKERVEQVGQNTRIAGRLSRQQAKRENYREHHNSIYRGQYGMEARELRTLLHVRDTTLNHMDFIPLSMNSLIKAVGERMIEERGIPLADQPAFLESLAREMTEDSMRRIGKDFSLGVTEHPKRGRILDVVRIQLPSPCSTASVP